MAERTDVEHAFVDLMYLSGDADHTLGTVTAVLDAAQVGP